MTTPNPQLITNLEVALAVAKNPERKWEYRRREDDTWKSRIDSPIDILTSNTHFQFRLTPITFPDPPPGDSWHNPDGLDAETVGVQDGWRLRLKSELSLTDKGQERWHLGSWVDDDLCLTRTFGESPRTYRTRLLLPSRSVLRDWSRPGDVPNGCWLRWTGSNYAHLILGVNPSGVRANGDHKWDQLSACEYSTTRNPDDWHPCKVQEGGK